MKKLNIPELFNIRAVLSSSIVLLHSIYIMTLLHPVFGIWHDFFRGMQLLLLYATPLFIMISEVILSHTYGGNLPKGFYSKRVKYIMVPYISMALVYAYLDNGIAEYMNNAFRYIVLGEWHGYFVLIIFQFYLLHHFLSNFLIKRNLWVQIGIAFIINFAYLCLFTLYRPYGLIADYSWIAYLWRKGFYMLPFAWYFYFVTAFYMGMNIDKIRTYLKRKQMLFLITSIISFSLLVFLYINNVLPMVSTKRPDIIIYAFSVFLLLFTTVGRSKYLGKILNPINRASYGIYLIHPMIQIFILRIMPSGIKEMNPVFLLIIVFAMTLGISLGLTYAVQKIPYGYWILGKLGKSSQE
ncbi:MAG: acyltransferase family protein [Clostridiales bacterium]|nr:acyltransferase family protein [Clostridiales bacterium]